MLFSMCILRPFRTTRYVIKIEKRTHEIFEKLKTSVGVWVGLADRVVLRRMLVCMQSMRLGFDLGIAKGVAMLTQWRGVVGLCSYSRCATYRYMYVILRGQVGGRWWQNFLACILRCVAFEYEPYHIVWHVHACMYDITRYDFHRRGNDHQGWLPPI